MSYIRTNIAVPFKNVPIGLHLFLLLIIFRYYKLQRHRVIAGIKPTSLGHDTTRLATRSPLQPIQLTLLSSSIGNLVSKEVKLEPSKLAL